ncbi:CST complex subunit STN1 [Acrasis kona]|uniref:CST complex subunit STN1 n=1 Tax=Acrasis kona TaxID=1008807 RepID=A0AAW2ZKU5_9EUKA
MTTTLSCYAKLFNKDILSMKRVTDGKEVKFLLNDYVISSCEVVGYIVSVDEWINKTTVMVDDGTEVLSCLLWMPDSSKNQYNTQRSSADICRLGNLVKVSGRLSTYKDYVQLVIYNITKIKPREECLAWLDRIRLRKFYNEIHTSPDLINNDKKHFANLDDKLYRVLCRHPNYSSIPFELDDILNDNRICSELDLTQDEVHAQDNTLMVGNALNELLLSGRAICRVQGVGIYELITFSDLVPHVRTFIEYQMKHNAENNPRGVHINFILRHVNSLAFFSNVKKNMIFECITFLMNEELVVFESGPERFTPL